ncbi:MAG TPA: DUF1707 domain-containing protein [Actinopolymorphaceae bacterium]
MNDNHPERARLRAADSDRDQVVQRLGFAMSEGRLDLAEYQSRLERAMAAKTLGELEVLTEDLPVSAEERRAAEKAREQERREKERRAWFEEWRTWLGAAVIMNGIWGWQSISSGEFARYWPAIPLGIWALILVASIFWPDDDKGEKKGDTTTSH